ncbi:hypothetical protein JCM17844_16660 [Iodidimonas gelatinilytica]|uniref:Cyclic nucleotide-binding domain-containing protein n=1 Tax=Iodidimonas gelatinilytica TaxID=1236966 RepID=A0A5A7MWZ3_9PROT|nr:cyclic nucleotide-binding domain-containing protein [Iodidimonas gelatinilytica]GEQ98029.1 hypothetical protein JCM17844_16660 [Iodidimonas gelatinilytica]GEQ99853.1 hypothetical protein JCM17845_04770 [Iodidimonas gelatinilytica]
MKTLTLPAGEIIYEEGDEAQAVFLIEDGAVEVSRRTGDRAVRLAVFGKGEVFGESGVIRNKVHSTTMRTLTDTVLLSVTKEQFLKLFSDNNPLGLPMLRMLSERLEKADERLIFGGTRGDDKAFLEKVGAIRILPNNEAMRKQIGEDGISLSMLPFRVGRRGNHNDGTEISEGRLSLHARNDIILSPEHFELEKRDGYLIIRDLGSHLGTIANGQHLSRFGHEATAFLKMGANDVTAGPKGSPYQFYIVAEPRGEG